MFSSNKAALKPGRSTDLSKNTFSPESLVGAGVSKTSTGPYSLQCCHVSLHWFPGSHLTQGAEILKQYFLSRFLQAPKPCLHSLGLWCLWTPHLETWLTVGVEKGMQICDKVAIFLELDSKKYHPSVKATRFDDHSLSLQVNYLQVLNLN